MSDIIAVHSFSKAVFSIHSKGTRNFRQTFFFLGEGKKGLVSVGEQSEIFLFSLRGALVKSSMKACLITYSISILLFY